MVHYPEHRAAGAIVYAGCFWGSAATPSIKCTAGGFDKIFVSWMFLLYFKQAGQISFVWKTQLDTFILKQ